MKDDLKLSYLPESNILSATEWKEVSKDEPYEITKKLESHIG